MGTAYLSGNFMIERMRKKISIMSSQNNYDFFKICPASAESNPYMHLVVKKSYRAPKSSGRNERNFLSKTINPQ